MFLSAAAPRLVIDPADSALTAIPGAVTFTDPGRRLNGRREDWHAAATARFVPRDPDDLDAYDAVYRWCFERFPRFVWLDEAADGLPVRRTPKAGNRYLVQGRKRQLGHLACTTRPRDIARNLLAQTQHVLVWSLPNPDDRRHIAELAGLAPTVLDAAMADLAEHEFLWWDQRARTLTHCPAVKL